jgi:ubiquinone/menaquinone biosynthesis C-methylase UbiE
MAPRFIAKQLSRPAGFLGIVIMQLMNRGNAKLNAFALEQLAPSGSDRVLEVGFGGGLLLSRLIARSRSVCGVDLSEQALSAAQSRYAAEIERERASFKKGDVEALPCKDASFDKAITVNTIYFWRSLPAGFAELHRVLSPGGRLVVGFLPKEFMDRMNMPSDIFTPRAPDEVTAAMRGAGFEDARIASPGGPAKWRVATGIR